MNKVRKRTLSGIKFLELRFPENELSIDEYWLS